MSQWSFNNFSTDIDFTDAVFMGKFEEAYETMYSKANKTPKVGKVSEIIKAQCEVFDDFFNEVFGSGTSDKMFGGKMSMELRVQAANSLYEMRAKEQQRYDQLSNKYRPNRQQRRHGNRRK